ncbi:MAG: hypothetical protein OEZ65_06605 [Gemmatimonadota bacterium]|nr:hypothetical protein [Gemmatimonadota bacterium]MDH5759242.1 hypothetical protein [Gemmatimonadota bacterium]
MGVLKLAYLFVAYSAVGAGGEFVVDALTGGHVASGHAMAAYEPSAFDVPMRHVPGGACDFEATREAVVGVSGSELLRIVAGSGGLDVEGVEGLGEIRVVARACATREADLDQLQVTLDSGSGEVLLSAHYPDVDGWRIGSRVASLDLKVQVPRGMAMDVEDSSGSMEIVGSGALRIDDGSGSITVRDALGDVDIDDGSGSVDVFGVRGDLVLEDGSGSLEIRDVTGAVRIDDGSGGVDVSDIGGDLTIRDGSGSISARRIEGNLIVPVDGSGSVTYTDVAGAVDVPSRGRRGR